MASSSQDETQALWAQLQAGDSLAESALFHRYLERLLALAHSRMSPQLQARVDEQDVVQSVYRSFFTRAREGRFILERSGDLWRLLAAITLNKVRSKAEFHRAAKRNTGMEALPQSIDPDESQAIQLAGSGPAPDDVVMLEEELHRVMQGLSVMHRQIIERRLRGDSVEEIAESCSRTEHQIRRVLNKVRDELEQRFQELKV